MGIPDNLSFYEIYHFFVYLLTSYGKYTPVTSLGLSSWGALWPEDQLVPLPVLFEIPLSFLINKLTLEVKQVIFVDWKMKYLTKWDLFLSYVGTVLEFNLN